MRNLVLFLFISLDGVAEEPSDWFFDTGPELFALIGEVIGIQDDVLLGRGTYDYWVDHWPTSDLEPFAPFINGTRKHVASSTELDGHWANTVRIATPVADYVLDLKRQPGGDIGVHGSVRLAQSLIVDGLVDELRLVIAPVVAGRGARLFPDGVDAVQPLELVSVESTPGGTLFVHYRAAAVEPIQSVSA